MITEIGRIYNWANPEYIRFKMSLEELVTFYSIGKELMQKEHESIGFESAIRQSFFAVGKSWDEERPKIVKQSKRRSKLGNKADIKGFLTRFGDKVKTNA